jgi:hypothetical protein
MAIPSVCNGAVETGGVKSSPSTKDHHVKSETLAVSNIDIIDIRGDAVEIKLKDEILSSLRPRIGPKTLPTLLLYDEQGLQLYEEV